VLGTALGSIFGGPAINKGRRWSLLVMSGLMMASTGLTLFRTIPTIMLGRFGQGIAGGVVNSAVAKSIFESTSTELYGVYGTATGTFMCIGSLICLLLGLTLPTDPEQFEFDKTWRLTYAFPILIALVIIVLQLTIYKFEPIDFSIKHGRTEEAIKLVRMLYKPATATDNDEETFKKFAEQRFKELKAADESVVPISFKEALTGRNYWRSTWTALGVALCIQFSGIGPIVIFSTTILIKLQEVTNGEFPIQPRDGTIFINMTTPIVGVFSFLIYRRVGRKSLLLIVHTISALTHGAIGLSMV
jgi:MFS family permease